MHPSSIGYPTLIVLARNTLCYWHGNQADRICAEWKEAIQDYLPEHNQRLAAVTPVKREPYEARDAFKQLQNGSAKESDASEQEIEIMRHALEEVKAELAKSEARCSNLIEKNSKLDAQREEEQASTSQILDSLKQLKQQLTDDQTGQQALEEQKSKEAEQLKKLLAEKNDEAKTLRSQLIGRNRNFQTHVAASSKEISRLEARVKELEALNRDLVDGRDEDENKLAASSKEIAGLEARVKELEALNRNLVDGRAEDATRLERLREQDRKVESLTKGIDAVRRELEVREVGCFFSPSFIYLCLKRERSRVFVEGGEGIHLHWLTSFQQDELSSLRPRNVRRGLWAVISWWPPRIVVRKVGGGGRKRGMGSYVQSGV